MNIDWNKMKENMKSELGSLGIGLLILPSLFLGMLLYIGILYNAYQSGRYSLLEFLAFGLVVCFFAWVIGTVVRFLLVAVSLKDLSKVE